MAEFDPQEQTLEQVEAQVQAMQWDKVSLDPDIASWEEIEKDLPVEWAVFDPQEEYSQEELQALFDAPIDAPEGDINHNAEQALQELDIDPDTLAVERDANLDLDRPTPEHDGDFGR